MDLACVGKNPLGYLLLTLGIVAVIAEFKSKTGLLATPYYPLKSGRTRRGFTTLTLNDGPPDMFMLGLSGRDLDTMRQANNTSAQMISHVYLDAFMLVTITADGVAVYEPIGDARSLVFLQIVIALNPVSSAR